MDISTHVLGDRLCWDSSLYFHCACFQGFNTLFGTLELLVFVQTVNQLYSIVLFWLRLENYRTLKCIDSGNSCTNIL